MAALKPLSDIQLLVGSHADPELFGEFYVRHLPSVTRYLLSSCGDRELTADLTAEVFAAALKARDRFSDEHGSALPWLLTIAKNKLTDCRRRGKADVAARRSLGVCAIPLENDDLARVEELADQALGAVELRGALDLLDTETRAVLLGRVVLERSYGELADEFSCSPQVVRKRVSRGLARLRAALEAR